MTKRSLLVMACVLTACTSDSDGTGGDARSVGDPAASGDPASGDAASGDPASGDPASGDPASGDPASGDPASGDPAGGDPVAGDPTTSIQQAVLEWQNGGCTTWCRMGWYSSPAVADLDNDGAPEVLGGTYQLVAVNGEDGSLAWESAVSGRVWPGIVVANLDSDTELEIVMAQGSNVILFDHLGNATQTMSPFSPDTDEIRGLAVANIDGAGDYEIIATRVMNDVNTAVLTLAGTMVSGWPQLVGGQGQTSGVFNDNLAVGDIAGNSHSEIIVPSDQSTIAAYHFGGGEIATPAFGSGNAVWGNVSLWENPTPEERGWGDCSDDAPRSESYRFSFATGAAVLADVDGNGSVEVVGTGNVQDCTTGPYESRYTGVYILNADRTRFDNGTYDWSTGPVDTGAPLEEDYAVIENAMPNPAVADLDDDGEKEILFSSYDGRVHAFWLDKTEHGNWPYSVYDSGEGVIRFSSEPVVVDIDNDGSAEVLVSTWPDKASQGTGHLIALDAQGNELWKVQLPPNLAGTQSNGGLAAPTVANIDADANLEVVLQTIASGLVAYELPGSAGARVLWGTGRGGYERRGQ